MSIRQRSFWKNIAVYASSVGMLGAIVFLQLKVSTEQKTAGPIGTHQTQTSPVTDKSLSQQEKTSNDLALETWYAELKHTNNLPAPARNKTGFGVITNGDPIGDTLKAEEKYDHRFSYVGWFQAWGDADKNFDDLRISKAHELGYVPIVTWEPWTRDFENPGVFQPEFNLVSITEGAHDNYISSWAESAKKYSDEIIIRFAHEQSTESGKAEWYPWQGNPKEYVAAFRYIVTKFREAKANNVSFMWSPLGQGQSWTHEYYPGEDYVDYLGTSILNFGDDPERTWAEWASFKWSFDGQYSFMKENYPGKPIFLSEIGTTNLGGDKAAWISAFFKDLQEYPDVIGAIYLDVPEDVSNKGVVWAPTTKEEVDSFIKGLSHYE